jgi:hypothetical protein
MGHDRVYDVIDDLLEDVPLVTLIEQSLDAEDNSAVVANTERLVNRTDFQERADELIELQKRQSLASNLDLRAARDLRDESDERRLQPRFIQGFFTRAYTAAGGTLIPDSHFPVYHMGKTASEILDVARQIHVPVSDKYDTPFVFDKNLVSVASRVRIPDDTKLLGPGHPLFSAVIEWAIRRARDAFAKGATIVDPNIARPQRIWLVRSSIHDGRREEKKRLAHQELGVIAADHLGLRSTSPANLLNYTTPESAVERPAVPEHGGSEIQMWSYETLTERQLGRVQTHRQTECDLRRDYLETTFTNLILELQQELNEVQRGQLFGDDDPEERKKLQDRIGQLRDRKSQRLSELDLMLRLTANLPDLVTSAIVLPAPVAVVESETASPSRGVPMQRDDEVEAIAMHAVMRYERSRGWTPTDVHDQGEHYDIRSESPTGEKRFIEVKGRAQTGAIVVTGPEVDKLKQLGDRAFLYVVTFCKSERPHLRIIQDPMAKLSPEMLYRQVQFIVQQPDWENQGEGIDDLPASD